MQKSGRKPGSDGGFTPIIGFHVGLWWSVNPAADRQKLSSIFYRLQEGLTLLELIMTLAVAAIVLAVGVPSFQNLIQNQRLTAAINQFVGALALARSEAIKRGVRVTLCKSADGQCCAGGGGYHQGWIVFADPNGDLIRQSPNCSNVSVASHSEPLVRVHQPLVGGLSLIGNQTVAEFISFVPAGVSQLSNGAFQAGTVTLCARGYAASARRLVLGRGGRVRVERVEPASRVGC